MTLLVVNADDFGYTPGVSRGIAEAFLRGLVTSTSVMTTHATQKELAELKQLQKEGLGVGVHLNLSRGRPLTDRLTRHLPKGFPPDPIALAELPRTLIFQELSAQIGALLRNEILPDHLDTHHHLHREEFLFDLVVELASLYRLGIRPYTDLQQARALALGLPFPERVVVEFFGEEVSKELLLSLLGQAVSSGVHSVELICHPGRVDELLSSQSSYTEPRERELAILTQPELCREVEAMGFRLATYRDLRGK